MEREKHLFLDRLSQLLSNKGTPLTSEVTICKKPLDLYRLYLGVKEKGGMVEVTEQKKWKEICGYMNMGSSASAAFMLKKYYIKYLFEYECQFDRGGIDSQTILDEMEQALAQPRKRPRSPVPRMNKMKKGSGSGFVDNWQSGKSLAECNLHMLTSEDSCDVSFRVGRDNKIVRAHRYVLISRSCVFHAMLCGPLAEKDEIKITDVEADIFSELLRYLYTDKLYPNSENVTGLLYQAKKYAVGGLEHLCLTYLKASLSAENACVILEQAHVFGENELYDTAIEVVLKNGDACVRTESFKHLCRDCFDKVIGSDQLAVKAEEIFSAAVSWMEEESRRQGREVTPATLRSILGQTLYTIPFHEMDQKHFVKEVIPRKILTSEETVVIMSHHACPDNDLTPFRHRQNRAVCRSASAEVVFYNRHKKVRSCFGKDIYSAISFTPSRDVLLTGVYVFGSPDFDREMYNVRVRQISPRCGCLLDSYCYSTADTKFDESLYIRTIYFEEPLNIKGGLEHYVNVKLCCWTIPANEGDGVVKSTTVDQCIFTEIDNAYHHSSDNLSMNLIYGLVIKQ